MSAAASPVPSPVAEAGVDHTSAFRFRRFLNWFPLGLAYAFLYMGRYNLTVAKSSLGDLMTNEDFGTIFGTGALVYSLLLFLVNGWLTDKLGGRRSMLIGVFGAAAANGAIGWFIHSMLTSADPKAVNLRFWMQVLYGANMYFQSMGAVAIVKANSTWFHIRERGSFSGIFGTMISAGIFFAFSVNGWILDWFTPAVPVAGVPRPVWVIFFGPAVLLAAIGVIEFFLLRDRPSQAGFADFDTGDADTGTATEAIPISHIIRRIVTNPIVITLAGIEFCTGVVRQGIMQWFPIYVKDVWVLPGKHALVYGDWSTGWIAVAAIFVFGAACFTAAYFAGGRRRTTFIVVGAAPIMALFFQSGWGGLLFVAGVIGGNVAGRVSDVFFQSRRAPAAGGLYLGLSACALAMIFALGGTTTTVGWANPPKAKAGEPPPAALQAGDRIVAVAGTKDLADWKAVARAVSCVRAACVLPQRLGGGPSPDLKWDAAACTCSADPKIDGSSQPLSTGVIPVTVVRNGTETNLDLPDPRTKMTAGDTRKLAAGPVLPMTPWFLGVLGFVMSICVIGTHGLLSGTATMDFGGRRGAATAVALIDGSVYLGTSLQGYALGHLTSTNWSYWPLFLLPFCALGFVLCLPIWKAAPRKGAGH